MNFLKRLISVSIIAAIALSLCACHKNGEIVVKVEDKEYTSGMYIAALYDNAITAIDSILEKDTDQKIDTSKKGFYRDQKIDGKVFADYLKEETLDDLKEMVAVKKLMDQYGIKFTKDEKAQMASEADGFWGIKVDYEGDKNYTFGKWYENNGVAKSTYADYSYDSMLVSLLFDKIYGKEGKKAISNDEIKKYFNENYIVVNSVYTSDYTDKTDEEKAKIKEQFALYEKNINEGVTTFEQVYEEVSGTAAQQSSESSAPQNEYYHSDSDSYKKYKDIENNKAKLIELDGDAGLAIIFKKDITADNSGAETYDNQIREYLKKDEYEKDIKKIKDGLKVSEIKSNLDGIKINKINFEDLYALVNQYRQMIQQQQAAAFQQ